MPMSSAAAVSHSMHPITTTSELAAACKRMAAHPFVTIDTEFLRETTYYPLLVRRADGLARRGRRRRRAGARHRSRRRSTR